MNKLKRTLALMAALAMTATAFVGCGDESSSSESSSQAESSADAEESSEEEGGEESSEEAEESCAGTKMTCSTCTTSLLMQPAWTRA